MTDRRSPLSLMGLSNLVSAPGSTLVHRRIQLILRAIANLLVCQGLGFGCPESSVCVAALVHRRIQLILRAIANLLVCQGLGFGRPESSVCVAALVDRVQ